MDRSITRHLRVANPTPRSLLRHRPQEYQQRSKGEGEGAKSEPRRQGSRAEPQPQHQQGQANQVHTIRVMSYAVCCLSLQSSILGGWVLYAIVGYFNDIFHSNRAGYMHARAEVLCCTSSDVLYET